MSRSCMPGTAGIIDIVFGCIATGTAIFFGIAAVRIWCSDETGVRMFMTLFVVCAVFGIIPLIGGICALKKQLWLMALIGSVFAISLLGAGAVSTVLIAMSKNEFK